MVHRKLEEWLQLGRLRLHLREAPKTALAEDVTVDNPGSQAGCWPEASGQADRFICQVSALSRQSAVHV